MKALKSVMLVVVVALLSLSTSAQAGFKIDKAGLAGLETVAVVGYSFFRDVEMEPANPFKFKQEIVELTPEDPEYQMMLVADDRAMEVVGRGASFTIMDPASVLENEVYVKSTKDPEKKLAANWYFPEGYRDIKLKKQNAIQLCEALGVDAVVQLAFKHTVSNSTSTTIGVFSKSKKSVGMKGEIIMIDKNGNTLISGSVKSDKLLKEAGRSYNIPGEGVTIEPDAEKTDKDVFYNGLLNGYLVEMNKAFGYEDSSAD